MFDTNKIAHFHPCVCHTIEQETLTDQTGKVWTLEEIALHKEELEEINQEVK